VQRSMSSLLYKRTRIPRILPYRGGHICMHCVVLEMIRWQKAEKAEMSD
jgi:hypothetical protein